MQLKAEIHVGKAYGNSTWFPAKFYWSIEQPFDRSLSVFESNNFNFLLIFKNWNFVSPLQVSHPLYL